MGNDPTVPDLDRWVGKLAAPARQDWGHGVARARKDGWAHRIALPNDVYAVAEGHYFDIEAAEHAADFFPRFLRLSKGKWKGQPFELTEWQREHVIYPVFGWKQPDGFRRFRKAYIEIPKKNGKSGLCSGIGLYMLTSDGESVPEVYAAARDREQASIIFAESMRMVQASPTLRKRVQVKESAKRLLYADGLFRPLSAEVASHEGLDISCALVDEVHVHRTRALLDTLIYGGAARDQALFLMITTAGVYDPTSIGWEQHEYATNIIDGTFWGDVRFYGMIYAADASDDIEDPKVWRKANPSLGITLKEEDIAAEVKEAKNSPAKLNQFLRYRLNVWTQTADAWMDMDRWAACERDYTPDDIEGLPCWGGMDLSQSQDLTCFALCFPPAEDGEPYRTLHWFWLPEDNRVERARLNNAPYDMWTEQGWLTLTAGNVVDFRFIRAFILEAKERYGLLGVNFDRYMGTEIVQNLMDDGLDMVKHATGTISMNGPMTDMERLVLSEGYVHRGNPIQTWMMGNVVAKRDTGGLIKPDKSNPKKKIDGPVAAMLALSGAMTMREPEASVLTEGFDVWV